MKIVFQKSAASNFGKVLVDGVDVGVLTKIQYGNGFKGRRSSYAFNVEGFDRVHENSWVDFKAKVRVAIAKARGEA